MEVELEGNLGHIPYGLYGDHGLQLAYLGMWTDSQRTYKFSPIICIRHCQRTIEERKSM